MTYTWRDFLAAEKKETRILWEELPGGEKVYRQGRALIIIPPDGNRTVLSSANFNGGLFENPYAVANMSGLPTPVENSLMDAGLKEQRLYTIECLRKVDLDPDSTVGLGTGVTMDKAVIVSKESGGTRISAVVTAGIEGNSGRAGDVSSYDEIEGFKRNTGTIVVILIIDGDLPHHAMARAVITATEAKSCALQQLAAFSRYSMGVCTGTGTDQVAVMCNHGSTKKFRDAGKHSLLGELIGKCVIEGVQKALEKWAGITPLSQCNVMKRLSRFKITSADIYYTACMQGYHINEDKFIIALEKVSGDPKFVSVVAAVIHLTDEISWGLINEKDGVAVGNAMIRDIMLNGDQSVDMEANLIENLRRATAVIAMRILCLDVTPI
jgi:adenosylcobinamide hydrolase